MRNLLAFDLGASNGRAILGQFDGEKITMKELHRFENNYVEMNGVFYWDTPYLYNQLKQGLLAFKQGGYGQLDAFGIDTWGVDYGLLDKNGHLAGVPRSYRLGTQADIDAVKEKIPGDVLYSRTGIDTKLTFNTIYQLYRRLREEDSALEIADTMLLTPDLLGYFLTGSKGTEYTIATTTGLYNPTTKDWDWQTIEELGLPKKIFTKIDKTGTIRGHLRKELCEELGLNPAAFVAVGSHDTASAVAAIPGKGSFAFCSSGTWSLFGAEMDKPDLSQLAQDRNFSNEGTIQGTFRPLNNIIGMWIIQECRRDWIKAGIEMSWDEIVVEARNIILKTRFCSGNIRCVWNPTMLYIVPSLFSRLNCTVANASSPVVGKGSPTGFIGPKRNVSYPRLAITSTGMQPSKTVSSWLSLSNSLSTAPSALTSAL